MDFDSDDDDTTVSCHSVSCHSVSGDDVDICQPFYDNIGPKGDDSVEHFYFDEDDDFLPKDHPFFHPSNLPCVQELLRDSQKRSNFSHLDPKL